MNYAEIYQRCYKNIATDFSSVEHFLNLLGATQGEVAELGAGTGRLAKHVLNRGLTLLESDQNMIRLLEEMIESEARLHSITPRERFRLPFESEKLLGLYLSLNSLGEMSPISFTMAEIARVLKSGGLLHFVNQNPVSIRKRKPGYLRAVPNTAHDIYRVSTGPSSARGPFSFETILEYSGSENGKFAIPQILPDWSATQNLLKMNGFEITESYGDYARTHEADGETRVFNLYCQKRQTQPPPPTFARLRDFYDSMARENDYDDVTKTSQYQLPSRLISEVEEIKNLAMRALDLGCGNGFLGRLLRQNGCSWTYFGVDFSRLMLEQCHAKGGYESVLEADLNDGIPVLEDKIMDVVLACGVTEFIRDIERFLIEIHRVLHNGGKALLTFEKTEPHSLKQGEEQTTGLRKFHYSRESIVKLLEGQGFVIESIQEFDAYHSPTLKKWVPYILVKINKP